MNKKKENNTIRFTPEQIENFVGFFHSLRRIHIRLIKEGYTIKDGKIIPPKKPNKLP